MANGLSGHFFNIVYHYYCLFIFTTRLSTVGHEEGGPSSSSLHGGADSGPDEKALLVQIEISMMDFYDGFLGWIYRMDFFDGLI